MKSHNHRNLQVSWREIGPCKACNALLDALEEIDRLRGLGWEILSERPGTDESHEEGDGRVKLRGGPLAGWVVQRVVSTGLLELTLGVASLGWYYSEPVAVGEQAQMRWRPSNKPPPPDVFNHRDTVPTYPVIDAVNEFVAAIRWTRRGSDVKGVGPDDFLICVRDDGSFGRLQVAFETPKSTEKT